MKEKILKAILLIFMVLIIALFLGQTYDGEAEEEYGYLFVTATELNGRSSPRKTGFIDAQFMFGQPLMPTGKWSRDHKWLEVYCRGEVDTVWVNAQYVSETTEIFYAVNTSGGRVRIRNAPFGNRTNGYLQAGKTVKIEQVIQGWGRCSKGWVDLSYLEGQP